MWSRTHPVASGYSIIAPKAQTPITQHTKRRNATEHPYCDYSNNVVKLYYIVEIIQQSVVIYGIQREIVFMTPEQTVNLAQLLREKRTELDLSIPVAAQRAHVDRGTLWRLEDGRITYPRAEVLIALGTALGIPPADLFTAVGWLPANQLPGLRTYLRTKYPDMPIQLVAQIEEQIRASIGKRSVGVYYGPSPRTRQKGGDYAEDSH
ncbi:transcriptional regulator [Mycobacteroides abscessus subsp. abscessus]|nr:XRE family transcriptional regulator [Mycobacteroides abscessus]SIF89298.1 transcriptional regulator [Mycobacteroides abscessus subsp. abscessus]